VIRAATLLFLAIGSTVAPYAATAGENTAVRDLHEQVDKVFAKWDSTVSPGCAVSVMKNGQIIYKRGYGMADLDHDIPINPETVFHVASISKQFTAAAFYYWRKTENFPWTMMFASTSRNCPTSARTSRSGS
jgi:CubicO group peptidase (beta-lactamase class C family)